MSSLSVVVVSWNQAEVTVACVDRVLAWHRLRPTVWVVDNASEDDSLERISGRPEVRLLESPVNLGFGGANNLALRETRDELVLLLNGDARLDEEGAIAMVEALQERPEVAVLGPLVSLADRSGEILTAGGRDISRHVGTHVRFEGSRASADRPGELLEVDYVPGTAALLRASSVARVGLFDEEYFFSGEMADLCERLRADGGASAVLTSVVATHEMETAGELRSTLYAYYSLRNRFLFVRKFRHRRRVRLLAFWLAYCLFFSARGALTGRWAVARVGALAVADGLRGRFGGQNSRVAGVKRPTVG